MAAQQEAKKLTEAEVNEWVRGQYQSATKYMAEHGVVIDQVITKESRYLAPYVAIWKLKGLDKQSYWVLSGDLPTAHIDAKVAATPPDVLRHFSLHWQLKAENILRDEKAQKDKVQVDFANLLIQRGQAIYELSQRDDLWNENKNAS